MTSAKELIASAEVSLRPLFDAADRIERHCFARVLAAFQGEKVAQRHFAGSMGYGYGDDGRDAYERVFARAMGAQAALVRPSVASGTHALTVCLFALLRPGQTLLYISGAPYDTLRGVIGIDEAGEGTLADWGISYRQIDLLPDGGIDLDAVECALREDASIALVAIQRSRGYSWRETLTLAQIGAAAKRVKAVRAGLRIMVDNCYGEFVCEEEPCMLGIDATVGSLIKNPGGGLAPTGGYIAGTQAAVNACAGRLTAPNLGGEIGSWAAGYQPYYQGLYMAPHAVNQAVKGAMLFAQVFEAMGYRVSPPPSGARQDIIQAIQLDSPEKVIAFCRAVQAASPIDAHVAPEPWPMPGYDHDVIMAAGTFIGGASIELSADAPMKPPYIVYVQGGLHYEQVRLAVAGVAQALADIA